MKIEYLRQKEFHDQSIDKFELDFANSQLRLIIDFFDERNQDYYKEEFLFLKVSSLRIQEVLFDDLEMDSIYSLEIFESINKRELFTCKMILLLGFGKQSLEIQFDFRTFDCKTL